MTTSNMLKAASWKTWALGTLSLIAAPLTAICQTPPPPGGGNGGNPDEPLNGVPIDSNLTLMFLAIAVVFGVVMFKRIQAKRAVATTTK